MEAKEINCPGCQAPLSIDMKTCPYCGRPVVITTFSAVNSLSNLDLNRYQANIGKNIAAGKGNESENEASLGFIFLKLKLYSKANEHFSKAVDTYFDSAELFMAAAVAKLEGKKAFLNTRDIINECERYLNIAIEIEPRGIFYYFLAYLRYDYHFRKGFRVSPTYMEYLRKAVDVGVSHADINTLFDMLGVAIPDQIRL